MFVFKDVLKTVLADTGLKASAFAAEIGRERTLVYKWLSGVSAPSVAYFPRIVEIVERRAGMANRLILLQDLRKMAAESGLPREVRNSLLSLESAGELLGECLSICALERSDGGERIRSAGGTPVLSPFELLFRALLGAVAGGLLWNILNRMAGWAYFMGSPEDSLGGAAAFLWGSLTSAPIPLALPFLFGHRAKRSVPEALVLIGTFTIAGGLAGLLYFSADLRRLATASGMAYAPRELLLVVAFSACLSFLPCLAAQLAASRTAGLVNLLRVLWIPVAAAFGACLFTLLIDLPPAQVLQLRGFAVGLAMRIALFYCLFSLADDWLA